MYDDLFGLLTTYIYDESYIDGVTSLRNSIIAHASVRERWSTLAQAIRDRVFLPEQPLALVNHGANEVLDENTDAEAYRWLDLLVSNVERSDGQIEPY